MSAGASDIPTDEDCEVLTPKKKPGKPLPSFRSPYLSSMNMNPRKAAMSAWKLPRTSLCDTPGGETYSARFTSLSNQHDQRSEWDMTPEFPRHTLPTRKHHSAPNVARDKEEMHNEITLLKKSLAEQKSDNQKMKVKLRRLEEGNAKREKQLEVLLDPTNRSEYIRSLVDKKPEGSVVVNGLKQRILKLEQQCREKENAISNLQSELRATNLQEMRMTVKNYFEEIQRLKLLLEASEKSGILESKVFRRQQKALSSTVLRLSEDLKQLQLDNAALREELDTDSPADGIKGYKEWSKYRLLRRLLELEKRLDERNALKTRNRMEQECQTPPVAAAHRETLTTPRNLMDQAVQTVPAHMADVGTETTEEDDVSNLQGRAERLEAERTQLHQALATKEEEVRQTRTLQQEAQEETRRQHNDEVSELRMEKEELEKRLERWRLEQTSERETERRWHRDEVQQLTSKWEQEAERWQRQLEMEQQQNQEELKHLRMLVQTLKMKGNDPCNGDQAAPYQDDRDDQDDKDDEQERQEHPASANRRKKKSEAGDSIHPLDGGLLDDVSLVRIQATFRSHLARAQHLAQSLQRGMPADLEQDTSATAAIKSSNQESLWPISGTPPLLTPPKEAEAADDAYSEDSDDSDDIVVAESYPRRNREAAIL